MSEGNGDVSQSKLPERWKWKRLDEVARIRSGQAVPSSTYTTGGSGTLFLQGNAEFGELRPSPVKRTSSPKVMTDDRAVLISVRAPVGATNLSPGAIGIGRGLAAVTPGETLDQRFLLWALRAGRSLLEQRAAGTTFPAITGEVLAALMVPVPPLEEQQRITSRISELCCARRRKTRCGDSKARAANRCQPESYRPTLHTPWR
jgi:type I restriction enzyme S subunit